VKLKVTPLKKLVIGDYELIPGLALVIIGDHPKE